MAGAVIPHLAQLLREVLLHVEQTALVPRVDHLEDVLVTELADHLGVELPVLGEQLEDAVLHAHAGGGLDKLTVGLRVELSAHLLG